MSTRNTKLVLPALIAVVLATTVATSLAYCQSSQFYTLTKEDLSRMQERAEALRLAGEGGWEQAYIALAKHEWSAGERATAFSRFIMTMKETSSCEWRTGAFRSLHQAMIKAAADYPDTKEYKQYLEDFSLHSKQILLSVPVDQQSMANGCGSLHASALSEAAHFWEKYDQGAAEKSAETMLVIATFLPQAEGNDIRSDAHLILSRIFEARGKYEQALASYDAAIATSDFARLGAEGELARQIMLTERVRLLALVHPGEEMTRTALTERVNELRTGTIPWIERVEQLGVLMRPMQIEAMTDVRIDACMHFIQTAPTAQAATANEEAAVLDLVSRLQGAAHQSIGRPDAALFAYDVLIDRTTDQAKRDEYTAQRTALIQQLNG